MTLKTLFSHGLKSACYAGFMVALPLIFCIVCMMFGPLVTDLIQRLPFDSNTWKSVAWKTSIGQHSDIRIHMVDDLFSRHKLIGMTRKQLIELLGQPSTFESAQSPYEYIYYLGRERSFICIDDEWLDIKFYGDLVVSAIDRTD
jgi:hypothetical protein